MNFQDIKSQALAAYEPAIVLEKIFPHSKRHIAKIVIGALVIAATVAAFVVPLSAGIAALLLVIWIKFCLLDAFYYSYYYCEVFMTFELAQTIFSITLDDMTGSFFATPLGQLLLLRLGITTNEMAQFLAGRTTRFAAPRFSCESAYDRVTLAQFATGLLADKELADFFFTQNIGQKEIVGAALWLERDIVRESAMRRWWSAAHLQKIPALGRMWSYGRTYLLDQYERPLPMSIGESVSAYGSKELAEATSILSRADEGNIMLVGDDEESLLALISSIHYGDKRMVLLDNELLVAQSATKQIFEGTFIGIMRQAVSAGNVVMVLANMPSLIASAASLGSDLVALLEPYVHGTDVCLIATTSSEKFHSVIEPNKALMERFEVITLGTPDESASIGILENESWKFVSKKKSTGVFFSYPALVALAESAEKYFPDGVMPDKAIDLLGEMAGTVGAGLVKARDVTEFIKGKTGIPMGQIDAAEKDKLSNLETLLRARIIGQDEAVVAIANAVRRARSGIENPNRPMASFLFLGPTGVGKTETTKALGDVFFGSAVNEIRLDMSEYSGPDALAKLIGSFENNRPGTLSSALRDHPYGVLLLDEFEKSSREVMNLFLQILDEGFFSDMSGQKVIARNVIIIATSNAGSDLIWQAVKEGQDLAKNKDKIVEQLISAHDFSPELLNRFDGVILFHPLSPQSLRTVAALMLDKLRLRLADRGVKLLVTDPLIDFVASRGTDPAFGARPMNRAIQDIVESKVAEKIINGTSKEVSFEAGDFA